MNAYTVRIKLASDARTVERKFHGASTQDAITWGETMGRVMAVSKLVALRQGNLEIIG